MFAGPARIVRDYLQRLAETEEGGDAALLDRYAHRGDEDAFAALLNRHGPAVLGVCRRALGPGADADDAFQAAFLALARQAGSIRRGTSLAGWLHRVAARTAQRTRRLRQSRAAAPLDADPPAPDAPDAPEAREVRRILDEELDRLPRRLREPLVLCYLNDATRDEAARTLGWSLGTLKRRLEEGRSWLHARLTRRGLAPAAPALAAFTAATLRPTVSAVLRDAALRSLAPRAAPARVAALVPPRALLTRGAALKLSLAALLVAGGLVLLAPARTDDPSPAQPPDDVPPVADAPAPDRLPLPAGALRRFGSDRFRHGEPITAAALSPNGRRLATISDRSLVVWDAATGRASRRFAFGDESRFAHPGLAFSPDSDRLACLRSEELALVWDLTDDGPPERINLWTINHLYRIAGPATLRFAPDGRTLHFTTARGVCVYDLRGSKDRLPEVRGVGGADLPMDSLARHPRRLSADGARYVRVDPGKAVIVGEVGSGRETARLAVAAECDEFQQGVAFAPDGRSVAVVGAAKEVQVWDLAGTTPRKVATFPAPESVRDRYSKQFKMPMRIGYRLEFARDGRTLLLADEDGRIHRFDLAGDRVLPPLERHVGPVTAMHLAVDGDTLLTAAGDGVVRRWGLASGRPLTAEEGYAGETVAVPSPAGGVMAVGDTTGRLDLWGDDGRVLRQLAAAGPVVRNLAFAPDGKSLAAGLDGGVVRVWSVPGGEPAGEFRFPQERDHSRLRTLLFSPDGRWLVAGDDFRGMQCWDVATRAPRWSGDGDMAAAFSADGRTLFALRYSRLERLDPATGRRLDKSSPGPDAQDVAPTARHALRVAPDAAVLASPDVDRNVVLSDSATGREWKPIPADATVLAFAGGVDEVTLLDGRTGVEYRRFRIAGPRPGPLAPPTNRRPVSTLAFSPDGRRLAVGAWDGSVRLLDARTGEEVRRFEGHRGLVLSVAFTADGQRVVSSAADGSAYLWDLRGK